MSAYVEIPRPYESAPGRFTVDLVFPTASKRRAKQHHDVAWALADVHGVEASTPFALNPRWSYYKEMCGSDERYGGPDERRLTVQGGARAVARYLVALERVLDEVEALATRAVRAFGAWKRSVAGEPFLEYEDASTMRVRSREFRADVLRALVQGLDARTRPVGERDSSRPLWEQYGAVAEEVRAAAGGVDLERADEEAMTAQEARMVPAAVAEAERLVRAEAARLEEQRLEEEREELFRQVDAACAQEADEADAERCALDGQGALFAVSEARPALVVPPPRPVKPRRAPRERVPVAARFPDGTTHVAISREQVEHFNPGIAAAMWPKVNPERRRYVPAA
ncbi:hypothetical protein [Streptomyces sp. 2131.1]|uniref:hypothetical protein n=1 Tax=Streptomyces sp. 2131.1 TaxID=1855346 RepID=UPI000B868D00|nr:hypothetical protein [Streptomyces sp. 2131.1]